MKKVLLYSGGMDSWLIDKIWKPDMKVYVNMHTRYSDTEINKIMHSGENITLVDAEFIGRYERPDAIIPLRNMYLLGIICNLTKDEDVEICLGATAGDRVLDKSPEFISKMEDLLNYLYLPQHWIPQGKKVKLNIDFKAYTKTDLIRKYIESGGKIEEAFSHSFSCYNPTDGKECWQCKPCFRKFVSFYNNGYKFDSTVKHTVASYIKREILPQILDGTYGRKQEEAEILKFIEDYDNDNSNRL